jgi:hypothetical protein
VLVSAALVLRLLPSRRVGDRASGSDGEVLSLNVLRPLGNLRFAALTFGLIIPQAIADQVFVSYLLALAMDALGSSVADIGRVMMIYFLVLILSGSVYGKLPLRYANPTAVAFVASLIAGVGLMTAVVWPTLWSFVIAAIGAGTGHGLSRGPQSVLTMELAEGALAPIGASAVLGAARVFERGGSVVGLLLVGYLTGVVGYAGATGVIGLILLGGSAILVAQRVAERGMPVIQGRNA